jgi:tetratricopeptide (TPR) repeat protein
MDKNKLLQQGFAHFSAKNYDDAVAAFEAAIELDNEFDLAFNALAESYNRLGRLDDAIRIAEKLVQLQPDDSMSHTALSRLYVQKGLIEKAEHELALSNLLAQKNG